MLLLLASNLVVPKIVAEDTWALPVTVLVGLDEEDVEADAKWLLLLLLLRLVFEAMEDAECEVVALEDVLAEMELDPGTEDDDDDEYWEAAEEEIMVVPEDNVYWMEVTRLSEALDGFSGVLEASEETSAVLNCVEYMVVPFVTTAMLVTSSESLFPVELDVSVLAAVLLEPLA